MSIKVKHCLTIVCDTCGRGPREFNDEGWDPHFETLDDAVEQLGGSDESEWLMTPTEHVCPRCRATRACALVGHEWSEWWTGDARGIQMSRRGCLRCDEVQVAPAENASNGGTP